MSGVVSHEEAAPGSGALAVNRLKVALSRAQCPAILVRSKNLLEMSPGTGDFGTTLNPPLHRVPCGARLLGGECHRDEPGRLVRQLPISVLHKSGAKCPGLKVYDSML